jgi:hypothetical protein
MVSVSQLDGVQLAIKLDREISCEEMCAKLQYVFNKLRSQNIDISNTIMTISIKSIIDSDAQLKLPYHGS